MIFMHVDNPGGAVSRVLTSSIPLSSYYQSCKREVFLLFNSSTTVAVSLTVWRQDLSSEFHFVLTYHRMSLLGQCVRYSSLSLEVFVKRRSLETDKSEDGVVFQSGLRCHTRGNCTQIHPSLYLHVLYVWHTVHGSSEELSYFPSCFYMSICLSLDVRFTFCHMKPVRWVCGVWIMMLMADLLSRLRESCVRGVFVCDVISHAYRRHIFWDNLHLWWPWNPVF